MLMYTVLPQCPSSTALLLIFITTTAATILLHWVNRSVAQMCPIKVCSSLVCSLCWSSFGKHSGWGRQSASDLSVDVRFSFHFTHSSVLLSSQSLPWISILTFCTYTLFSHFTLKFIFLLFCWRWFLLSLCVHQILRSRSHDVAADDQINQRYC